MGFCVCLFFVLLCNTLCHSSFASILTGKRELVAFTLIVFLTFCDCSVALPHGAVGWSAVFNCGVSILYLLFSHPHSLIR